MLLYCDSPQISHKICPRNLEKNAVGKGLARIADGSRACSISEMPGWEVVLVPLPTGLPHATRLPVALLSGAKRAAILHCTRCNRLANELDVSTRPDLANLQPISCLIIASGH